jgi:hypothetical protein
LLPSVLGGTRERGRVETDEVNLHVSKERGPPAFQITPVIELQNSLLTAVMGTAPCRWSADRVYEGKRFTQDYFCNGQLAGVCLRSTGTSPSAGANSAGQQQSMQEQNLS